MSIVNQRYAKVREGLYLHELELERPQPTKQVQVVEAKYEPETINHIWIIDRSGSMTYNLPGLVKDLEERAMQLEIGDTVSVGWFSCPGNYRFALKGYKVSAEQDKAILQKAIQGLVNSIGSTCFSEILGDLPTVLDELTPISPDFALMFLTDGYPTVYPYEKEVKSILANIDKLAGRISSVFLVGYGNYYNKELMTQMAARFGGSLIHSGDLPTFQHQFKSFVEEVKSGCSTKILVDFSSGDEAFGGPFTVTGKRITLLEKQPNIEEGSLLLSVPVPKRGTVKLYGFSNTPQPNYSLVTPDFQDENDSMVKGAYAAAFMLSQKLKTDLALEVIGWLGDLALADKISNAFTPDDYGKAEAAIMRAVERKDARFTGGWKPGCVPDKNAFCVLDALDILLQDDTARFFPYHPEFKYNRIGVPSKPVSGYPEFEAYPNPSSSLDKMVWNDKFLNLSIQAIIPGFVTLAPEGVNLGLPEVWKTQIFRNYAIIKDGFLNVSVLPVLISKSTYSLLADHGLIDEPRRSDMPSLIHLDRIPVMNRAMADGLTSAATLCKALTAELELEAQLKVYNARLKELEPDKKLDGPFLTEEQKDFLKTQGIGWQGYSVPVTPGDVTDHYMASEFQVKIKGFSSLPKLEEVEEKVKAGKPLTPSQTLLNKYIEQYDKSLGKLIEVKRIDKLKKELADAKSVLRGIRNNIQRTKFSVILGKKWFNEFTSRDNSVLDYNGLNFTFALREVKVDL